MYVGWERGGEGRGPENPTLDPTDSQLEPPELGIEIGRLAGHQLESSGGLNLSINLAKPGSRASSAASH